MKKPISDELYKTILDVSQMDFFTGNLVTDSLIKKAEDELDVKLPDSYVWYLKEFGQLYMYGGMHIYGVEIDAELYFVNYTKYLREFELPHELIILQENDEYEVCLSTNDGKVGTWSYFDNDGFLVEYDNFYEYLEDLAKTSLQYIEDEGIDIKTLPEWNKGYRDFTKDN